MEEMRQDPKLLLVQEVLDRTWKEGRHFIYIWRKEILGGGAGGRMSSLQCHSEGVRIREY